MAAGRQKNIICGMEEENDVTYGRLPSPTRQDGWIERLVGFLEMIKM